MGKKKSFTTGALASLTGKAPEAKRVEVVTTKEEVEPEVINTPEVKKAPEVKPLPSVATKKSTTRKKKSTGLQDPNKRSVKKSHTPVTLYLNATNLERLKQYAEEEEQKISWLIDEMIYDYLSEKL
jgi:hypothetical protein